MYICIYRYIEQFIINNTYIHMYVCMCVFMYVCMYVYIYL